MYRKYDSEICYKSKIDDLIEDMVENIMSYEIRCCGMKEKM